MMVRLASESLKFGWAIIIKGSNLEITSLKVLIVKLIFKEV